MKKIVFVVLALIVVVGMVQASDMRFGFKSGLVLGNVSDDMEFFVAPEIVLEKKMKPGLALGGMVHMPLMEGNLVLMGELGYLQKGACFETKDSGYTFDGYLKADYIQLDLLAKYMFHERIGIFAGPGLGYLLSAEMAQFVWEEIPDPEMNGEYSEFALKIDAKDEMKSMDFSLNIGAQFSATDNLIVDIRYNLGLTNIVDVDDEGAPEFKNSAIILGVGYLF